MKIVALLVLMLRWLPPVGGTAAREADIAFRLELADAIATDEGITDHEARLLARIARFESHYRRDVATCKITGGACDDAGLNCDLGPFQHHATTTAERLVVCGSLAGAVRVARQDVRHSFHVCRELPQEERLAAYARGPAWRTDEAKRLSRVRWTP